MCSSNSSHQPVQSDIELEPQHGDGSLDSDSLILGKNVEEKPLIPESTAKTACSPEVHLPETQEDKKESGKAVILNEETNDYEREITSLNEQSSYSTSLGFEFDRQKKRQDGEHERKGSPPLSSSPSNDSSSMEELEDVYKISPRTTTANDGEIIAEANQSEIMDIRDMQIIAGMVLEEGCSESNDNTGAGKQHDVSQVEDGPKRICYDQVESKQILGKTIEVTMPSSHNPSDSESAEDRVAIVTPTRSTDALRKWHNGDIICQLGQEQEGSKRIRLEDYGKPKSPQNFRNMDSQGIDQTILSQLPVALRSEARLAQFVGVQSNRGKQPSYLQKWMIRGHDGIASAEQSLKNRLTKAEVTVSPLEVDQSVLLELPDDIRQSIQSQITRTSLSARSEKRKNVRTRGIASFFTQEGG